MFNFLLLINLVDFLRNRSKVCVNRFKRLVVDY